MTGKVSDMSASKNSGEDVYERDLKGNWFRNGKRVNTVPEKVTTKAKNMALACTVRVPKGKNKGQKERHFSDLKKESVGHHAVNNAVESLPSAVRNYYEPGDIRYVDRTGPSTIVITTYVAGHTVEHEWINDRGWHIASGSAGGRKMNIAHSSRVSEGIASRVVRRLVEAVSGTGNFPTDPGSATNLKTWLANEIATSGVQDADIVAE